MSDEAFQFTWQVLENRVVGMVDHPFSHFVVVAFDHGEILQVDERLERLTDELRVSWLDFPVRICSERQLPDTKREIWSLGHRTTEVEDSLGRDVYGVIHEALDLVSPRPTDVAEKAEIVAVLPVLDKLEDRPVQFDRKTRPRQRRHGAMTAINA